jgi:hypothetical protein
MLLVSTAMLSAHPDHGGGGSSGGSAAAPVAEDSGEAGGQTSGLSRATAGLFGTDVDSVLDVNGFSGVLDNGAEDRPGRFFAFTRVGQSLFRGNLELGVATRINPAWYLALYYNGWLKAGGDVTKSDVFYFKKPDEEPEGAKGTYQTGNQCQQVKLYFKQKVRIVHR